MRGVVPTSVVSAVPEMDGVVRPTPSLLLCMSSRVGVVSTPVLVLSLLNSLPNSALTDRPGTACDGIGSMMAVLSESGIAFIAHTINPAATAITSICATMKGQVRAVGL